MADVKVFAEMATVGEYEEGDDDGEMWIWT